MSVCGRRSGPAGSAACAARPTRAPSACHVAPALPGAARTTSDARGDAPSAGIAPGSVRNRVPWSIPHAARSASRAETASCGGSASRIRRMGIPRRVLPGRMRASAGRSTIDARGGRPSRPGRGTEATGPPAADEGEGGVNTDAPEAQDASQRRSARSQHGLRRPARPDRLPRSPQAGEVEDQEAAPTGHRVLPRPADAVDLTASRDRKDRRPATVGRGQGATRPRRPRPVPGDAGRALKETGACITQRVIRVSARQARDVLSAGAGARGWPPSGRRGVLRRARNPARAIRMDR